MVKRAVKRQAEKEKKGEIPKKTTYFSKLKHSLEATRFGRKYWHVFFISLAYLIISMTVIIFIARDGLAFLSESSDLSALDSFFSAASAGSVSHDMVASVAPILSMILGIVILAFLLNFFVSAGFNGWIWRKITGQKMNFKFYWKYLAFRAILGLGILILLAIGVFIEPLLAVFAIAAVILYHLFFAGSVFLAKSGNLLEGIKAGFKKGARIHLFILPYLFFAVLLAIQYVIVNLVLFRIMIGDFSIASIVELAGNFSGLLKTFLPFSLIAGAIGAFFSSYIKIFYAEFVSRI